MFLQSLLLPARTVIWRQTRSYHYEEEKKDRWESVIWSRVKNYKNHAQST